mgnify:CR=1 FL=1
MYNIGSFNPAYVGTVQDPRDPKKSQTLMAFAQEQAYKELQKDQLSFCLLDTLKLEYIYLKSSWFYY